MKKAVSILLILFTIFCAVGCKNSNLDLPYETPSDYQQATSSCEYINESSILHTHKFDDNNICTVCGQKLYDFEFVSNGDGTCYVSKIITIPYNTKEYVLTIPEKSPSGDTVTEIRCEPLLSPIPKIISADDMNGLFSQIKENIKDIYDDFKLHKIMAYYKLINISEMISEETKQAFITEYPLSEITALYVLDPATTASETVSIYSILRSLTNYSSQKLSEYYDNLYSIINESDAKNKDILRLEVDKLPTSFSSGITNIQMPSSLQHIDISFYQSCCDLKELIIPNCMTEIPENAFNLPITTVSIPNTIANIGKDAFSQCVNLDTINFDGTKDEWKNHSASIINLNKGCQIICSDGTIAVNF